MNSPRPNSAPQKSLEDVRRSLKELRPPSSTPRGDPSFMDLLKNPTPNDGQPFPGFRSIQESLKRSSPPPQRQSRWSTPFMPQSSHNIFNKEREGNVKEDDKDSGTTLTRPYSYEELGKRLGELRSAGAVKDGKEWFSLEELQGRIAKLWSWRSRRTGLVGSMLISGRASSRV